MVIILIKIKNLYFNFKLEPIVNIFNNKVKGYEILSCPHDLFVNAETYFNSLPNEMLAHIFYEQLYFFNMECFHNPTLVRNLFINAPLSLLISDNFILSIYKYIQAVNLNIEIQYTPHILKSQLLNQIRCSLPYRVNVWVDDVDIKTEKIVPVKGIGLKIDKYSFWNAYEKKSDMNELYSFCPDFLIIEGIETTSHLEYLMKNNITLAQGYYWPSKKY